MSKKCYKNTFNYTLLKNKTKYTIFASAKNIHPIKWGLLRKMLVSQTAFNKHDFACGKDTFVISVIKQKAIQFKISIFDFPRRKILKIIKLSQTI